MPYQLISFGLKNSLVASAGDNDTATASELCDYESPDMIVVI